MTENRVTTVGWLLAKLVSDDRTLLDRIAMAVAIPLERLERVARGERSLRPMEQLRFAEWLIQHVPSLRRHAYALRAQVLATGSQ